MKFIGRLRRLGKRVFDRIRNDKLKHNLLQAIPFWIASLLTGIVAVAYSKLFALAEKGTAYIVHLHVWLLFIITPVCFLVAWWLVRQFAPFARGSGIPQVMASIELATPKYNEKVNKLLSLRVLFIKILSSLIMALGGGVIGREGPTIQVAGSIFRKVNEWLPKWWPKISKRNMIMTGAAAGLAAAFNTPLGGVVFAVEELTRTHISYFKTALFTAVIIAGLTAQALLGALSLPWISRCQSSFGNHFLRCSAGGDTFRTCWRGHGKMYIAAFSMEGWVPVHPAACFICGWLRGIAGSPGCFCGPTGAGIGEGSDDDFLIFQQQIQQLVYTPVAFCGPPDLLYNGCCRRCLCACPQCRRQFGSDIIRMAASVANRHQPDRAGGDGRLSHGCDPDALYFRYIGAGNDRSPQCYLPSPAGRDDREPGSDHHRQTFLYDHLKYQYLREIVGEEDKELMQPHHEEPEEDE